MILEDLLTDLDNADTLTAQVFFKYQRFLALRVTCPAFHPNAKLIPVAVDNSAILAFIRTSRDDAQRILVVQNVSAKHQQIRLPLQGLLPVFENQCHDLMSGEMVVMDTQQHVYLDALPFEGYWIELYRKGRNGQ